jgi:hypothetical protein
MARTGSEYCCVHSSRESKLVDYVNIFLDNAPVFHLQMTFTCLCILWNHPALSNKQPVAKKYIALQVLCYILNGNSLRKLSKSIHALNCGWNVRKYNIAFPITQFFWKLFKIKHSHVNCSFARLQSKWKGAYYKRLSGPYPYEDCVNENEAFSMEPIQTIPSHLLFSYKDANNKVYVFNSTLLQKYSVEIGSVVNPFTRQPIPDIDATRLFKLCAGLASNMEWDNAWKTPHDAWTAFVHELEEQSGIQLLLNDLMLLSANQLYGVFYTFHDTTQPNDFLQLAKLTGVFQQAHLSNDVLYFEVVKVFAEECITLFKSGHVWVMWYICVLCASLSNAQPNLMDNIPSWVFDAANS